MAISRVSGQMLQTNLERDGVNLSVSDLANSTPVLYLDVTNNYVGVNTGSPTTQLTVSGGTSVTGNITSNSYFIGDGSLLSNINAGNIIGSYGNANVAMYLPVYYGNIGVGNINSSVGNLVTIGGTAGLVLPAGNNSQRPSGPNVGTVRFNTVIDSLETWSGNAWVNGSGATTSITTQIIDPDGVSTTYTLNQPSTAGALLVAINGVEQIPGVAYLVAGNQIAFVEIPLPSDTVVIRFITTTSTISALANDYGNTGVQCLDTPAIQFQISGANAAIINSQSVLDISSGQGMTLPTFTVAQAGNLSNVTTGTMIYVSNGDTGNPCLAVYSGGAFKCISLGANIST